MQKEKTAVLVLKLFGHAVLGNIMGVITAFSFASFIDSDRVNIFVSVIAFILYHLMIMSSSYKSSSNEKKLLKMKRIENARKKEWLAIGGVVGGVMLIPTFVLMICLGNNIDFILPFRFISGAVFSLVMCLPPDKYIFAPFIYMIVYLLTPLSAFLGGIFAFNESITMDKIIYKK